MGANQHTSKGRKVPYRIMFTTEEKAAVDARAAAEGVTLADLIRGALGLAEAPQDTCYRLTCRYYGQRHGGEHEPHE